MVTDKASTPSSVMTNFLLKVTSPERLRQKFKLRHLHQRSGFQKHQATQGTQSNPQNLRVKFRSLFLLFSLDFEGIKVHYSIYKKHSYVQTNYSH